MAITVNTDCLEAGFVYTSFEQKSSIPSRQYMISAGRGIHSQLIIQQSLDTHETRKISKMEPILLGRQTMPYHSTIHFCYYQKESSLFFPFHEQRESLYLTLSSAQICKINQCSRIILMDLVFWVDFFPMQQVLSGSNVRFGNSKLFILWKELSNHLPK